MDINVAKVIGTRLFSKGLFTGQKYSPQILTAVGIVGFVTASVMASRSTLKLETTLDQAKFELDLTHEQRLTDTKEEFSDMSYRRDLTKIYATGTLDIIRLYGPAITLTLGSIACVVGAHGIMQKRNVALVAAYKTIETAFSEYRKRVVDDLGIDKDREYRFGSHSEEIEDAKGVKKSVTILGDDKHLAGYAKYFEPMDDEGRVNENWVPNVEYNMYFLRTWQNYLNDRLHSRGHVFLNEVYDRLGLPRTPAGAVVGWIISDDDNSDNFIDFGLGDFRISSNEREVRMALGLKDRILLDFNVNGVIYDKI